MRLPNSFPYPDKRAGSANAEMPFDHIVVVMMENHSFDNLLGALPRLERSDVDGAGVDGLTFDASGAATNTKRSEGNKLTTLQELLQAW